MEVNISLGADLLYDCQNDPYGAPKGSRVCTGRRRARAEDTACPVPTAAAGPRPPAPRRCPGCKRSRGSAVSNTSPDVRRLSAAGSKRVSKTPLVFKPLPRWWRGGHLLQDSQELASTASFRALHRVVTSWPSVGSLVTLPHRKNSVTVNVTFARWWLSHFNFT